MLGLSPLDIYVNLVLFIEVHRNRNDRVSSPVTLLRLALQGAVWKMYLSSLPPGHTDKQKQNNSN